MPAAPKKKKDPADIAAKVRADPATAQIAEKLGVPLEEYIEGVVMFAMNPNMKPEYLAIDDEVQRRQFGLNPDSMEAMLKKFDDEVEIATVAEKTDYRAPKAPKVALPEAPAADEKSGVTNPKLKAEADKLRRGGYRKF